MGHERTRRSLEPEFSKQLLIKLFMKLVTKRKTVGVKQFIA